MEIVLAPKLDGSATSSLHEALLEMHGRDVILKGHAVRHLGAMALQVLIAARKTWLDDGASLRVDAPSEALLAGLARLGTSIDAITVEAAR